MTKLEELKRDVAALADKLDIVFGYLSPDLEQDTGRDAMAVLAEAWGDAEDGLVQAIGQVRKLSQGIEAIMGSEGTQAPGVRKRFPLGAKLVCHDGRHGRVIGWQPQPNGQMAVEAIHPTGWVYLVPAQEANTAELVVGDIVSVTGRGASGLQYDEAAMVVQQVDRNDCRWSIKAGAMGETTHDWFHRDDCKFVRDAAVEEAEQ